MKNKLLIAIITGLLAMTSQLVLAEKVLSMDEAKALFTDKTFDGYNEKKGKSFRVYSSSDGTHVVQKKSGKIRKKTWKINDQGQHCVKDKCADVIDVGGGVYHKKRTGKHTHTLKNFVDGNQL